MKFHSIRYSVVKTSGTNIHQILAENCLIFKMENNAGPEWLNYKKYVDDIVSEAIFSAVGCRLVTLIFWW